MTGKDGVSAVAVGTAAEHPLIERPPRPLTGLRRLGEDAGGLYAANGLIGLIFAATGPVETAATPDRISPMPARNTRANTCSNRS